jgi:hypothetical protein
MAKILPRVNFRTLLISPVKVYHHKVLSDLANVVAPPIAQHVDGLLIASVLKYMSYHG